MPKEFFDVFPTLKVNDNLRGLLSQATVTRVTVTSARDRMRVYLESPRLLYWQSVQDTEHEIRRQIFGNASMDVKIIVKFQLSRQYTPRTLMQEYASSILSEIRDYNIFLYSILRQAECTFTADDEMTLTIEKNVIAEERLEELLQILEKIFCERCGMHFKVQTVFKEPVESKSHKNSELRIQQEVDAILQNAVLGNPEEPQNLPEENGQVEAAKAEGKTETAKKEKAKPEKKNDGKSEKKVEKQAADMPKSRENFQGKGGFRSGFSRGDGSRSVRRSDNPDVLYGRDFESESLAIEQIQGEMGEVTIRGQVQTLETRDIRNNKTIIMMEVTDFTDTIVIKIFAQTEQVPEILKDIKTGAFLKIRGVTTIDRFDGQLSIGSVFGIKKIQDFRKQRVDTWPEKRVELHCHTKMSDMDGVSDVKDIINRAKSWGHKAIAITDHGVVQAFPDANHAVSPDEDFKIIYGCEAYLVDDLQDLVVNSRNQSLEDAYVVFDLETTGFSTVANKIIEIGAVKVVNGKITDKFSTFVNPEVPIPYRIEELTSINDNMVLDAPTIEEILPKFLEFSEGCVMVAHNASFDMGFIEANCKRQGIEKEFTVVDTVALARVLMPQLNRFKLDTVAKALKGSLENHHRAVDDAGCTAEIFVKFIEMLQQRDITTLDGVNELGRTSVDKIRKSPSHHAILLATNDLGRINLYRLVSCSHLKYYNRRPLIPKSEFVRHREGLLLGSACEAGELYQAVLNHEEHINNISYITTLAGFIHYRLTGKNVLGIGDASGMFPVDSDTHEYDELMINIFNNLPNNTVLPDIRTLLPKILVAGDDAGVLTKEGALLLDPTGTLQPGCILCPPEGDAGTGMTATNSIRQETGNVSAGTSIFSMVVLKHSLKSLHREIDMVTTPDGSPVAMVHCNNCTSDINAWINIFREFAKGIGLQINDNDLYTFMFTQAGMGEADCGSLMSYNCYSGEPVIGLNQGCPMFIHPADSHFTLANFMRTNIYSALAPIKTGMDILLNDEHIKLNRIMGHGGLFKTPVIGQRMLAAAIDTPVSVMSNAGEGGAWGIAILAAYSSYIRNFTDCQKKDALSLADYLDHYIFNSSNISTVEPVPDDVTGFNTFIMNYKKMLPVEKTAVTTNI